ncbi:SDR family oxidoreductase [Thalassospira lucentensis]|jgi:2-keto-3-deoxy-L-fuconate dehydrogenase|uniref:NAD(P)-dependent oxidoreductase n=1 Tax=Thalassospira lucentensis TaxID=168935 RepID=A0A358HN06_9PROT|nr:SDR family oxidoreductase [Thalassospira lucentensis]HBU96537.1 NAD(P)-dependent oxidoreductase [Thalassospira lucentensis]HCW65859.1 NAD(P)-dependent oxidoreductase [Thalassospira lucentensis]
MKRIEGKLCLVTAAGQGIGRASAERLAAEGGRVIATDINDKALAELAAIDGIEARKLDVTDKAAITSLVDEIGTVDVLFNCAGIVHNGTILEATEEEWDFAFDLNVKSQFRMIRAVLPGMIEKGHGSIINMSSVAGPVTGPVNRLVYSASKAAVAGMTRAIANDYVKQGIRCNAIAPGTVDSPSLHERLRATGDYDGALKAFIGRQPMGRIGKPEEIAALVTYLASEESGFTTGVVHVVDGGWTA